MLLHIFYTFEHLLSFLHHSLGILRRFMVSTSDFILILVAHPTIWFPSEISIIYLSVPYSLREVRWLVVDVLAIQIMDDPHNLDSHASDCVKKKHLTCTPKEKEKKKKKDSHTHLVSMEHDNRI